METEEVSPDESTIDDEQNDHTFSIDDVIETLGTGKFHILLILSLGLLNAADSMELAINSILSPILQCEWHLSNVQEAMISTVAFLGQGIGAFGWGFMSDKYGRKATLFGIALTLSVFGIASSQAPVYWSMLLFRCLIGIGVGGSHVAWALLSEVTPIRQRSKTVLLMHVFWTIGSVVAAAIAIGAVNGLGWRYYLLIISSPSIVFLIASWWIPESPRYLLISGQMDKLNSVMERIAKVNDKVVPKRVDLKVDVQHRGRISDLFTKELRSTTLLLFTMWFTTAFCTYGIALLTTQMFKSGIDGCHPHVSKNHTTASDNCRRLTNADYTHYMTTSGSEILMFLIVYFVIDVIGRKRCLTIEYTIGFLSIMALLFCSSRTIVVALIFIFRGALASSFGSVYLYSAEMFPTNVRSVGLGCCSMFGRLGSMITPFVAQVLIHQSFYSVIVVYSIPLVLSVISSLLLKKETNQQPLQDQSDFSLKHDATNYQTFD